MQLYNGLPVITNKITPSEQRGVPHHLLGRVGLDAESWTVDEFKSHATKTIREIRSRGNVPILVGGTNYYVDAILFKEVVLDVDHGNTPDSFSIMDEPTDVILDELRKVDPVMADRWHPNDRRKIQRSLEIYLKTGKRASDLYSEQGARKAAAAESSHASEPWEKLLFWVYAEREALCERLDNRVDKMLDAGLLKEVRELYDFKQRQAAEGNVVDLSKGIWQSIGYRQFEPYLDAVEEGKGIEDLERLKLKALEEMKTATRRYANYQTRWIRLKQILRLKEQGADAMKSLYVMDSTNAAEFTSSVLAPATEIAVKFLHGEPLPEPAEMSELASQVLVKASEEPPKQIPCKKTCEVCGTTAVTEAAWTKHIAGAAHRRVLRRKKRRALVPVEQAAIEADEAEDKSGSESSPEIGSIFQQ